MWLWSMWLWKLLQMTFLKSKYYLRKSFDVTCKFVLLNQVFGYKHICVFLRTDTFAKLFKWWVPRSVDRTFGSNFIATTIARPKPIGIFYWACLKENVYNKSVNTVKELRARSETEEAGHARRIRRVCNAARGHWTFSLIKCNLNNKRFNQK